MRYLDWDLLMFSNKRGEDKTPFQEFRTACFGALQEAYNGEQIALPVVSGYITSKPAGMPFRVSVYPWETPILSSMAQKECDAGRKIAFRLTLEIDGVIVGNNVTGYVGRWPQIMNWNENMFDTEEVGGTSKDKFTLDWAKANMEGRNWIEGHEHKGLLFPAYEHTEPGEQRDAITELEPHGRIKLTIAEGWLEDGDYKRFVRIKDVVVFSFFHAPTAILEARNISWPSPMMWIPSPSQLELVNRAHQQAVESSDVFGEYLIVPSSPSPSPDRTDGRALHHFSRDSTPVATIAPQATVVPEIEPEAIRTPSPNKRKTRSGTVLGEESPTKKLRSAAAKLRRTSMRVHAQKAVMV